MSDCGCDTESHCKICQNPFDIPKFVDCLHTFCEGCIVNSASVDSPKVFTCPVCKQETNLIDGSTKYLGTNSYISSLQSVNAGIQAGVCIVCSLADKEVNSSHICLSCNDNLCEICAKGHNSSTLTASHRVVSLEELEEQKTHKKTELSCHVHPCTPAKAFCHSCCKAICVECVLSEHKSHPSAILESAVTARLKNLSKRIKTESSRPVIENAVQTATSELEQLNLEEKEFFKILKESTAWLITKIEKESEEVFEQGRKAFDDERKIREKRLQQAKYQSQRRENILEVCNRFLTSGGLEVLETGQSLQKALKLVTEQNQPRTETQASFKVEIHVPKDQNLISFKEVLPQGKENDDSQTSYINITKDEKDATTNAKKNTPAQSEKKTTPNGAASLVTADPLSSIDTVNQIRGTPLCSDTAVPGKTKSKKKKKKVKGYYPLKLMYKRSFSVKVMTDKEEPEVSCMQFRSPDTCLLMDKTNRKLKVMKLSGQLSYLVNLRDECPPFDRFIHFSSGDFVFAVYENKLMKFNRHLKLMSEVPLVEKESYSSSRSPVVANYGENVLVGNLANNEMRVLDENGVTVRSWTSKFSEKQQQQSITYVADDKVVMTSRSGPVDVMFESETSGNLLTIESSYPQPSQAVVDSHGRLIYCVPKDHTISVFTSKRIFHVSHKTLDQSLEEPTCLMLDSEDQLYVSCKSGQIGVYEVPSETV